MKDIYEIRDDLERKLTFVNEIIQVMGNKPVGAFGPKRRMSAAARAKISAAATARWAKQKKEAKSKAKKHDTAAE